MEEAFVLLVLRDALVLLKPTSSVLGETELDSLSMSRPCYQCFKVLPPWRAVEEAEIKQREGPCQGGEGQLTVDPEVPFRLLVTACPC